MRDFFNLRVRQAEFLEHFLEGVCTRITEQAHGVYGADTWCYCLKEHQDLLIKWFAHDGLGYIYSSQSQAHDRGMFAANRPLNHPFVTQCASRIR